MYKEKLEMKNLEVVYTWYILFGVYVYIICAYTLRSE